MAAIELTIDKRMRDLGGGFEVGRILPYARRRMVGPFIFLDQMGPLELAPGIPRSLDVRPHPHIGLATVTYLFDGALTHRDSAAELTARLEGCGLRVRTLNALQVHLDRGAGRFRLASDGEPVR